MDAACFWRLIETCPFESLKDREIFVKNDKYEALVTFKVRVGRPVRMIEPAGMVETERGREWREAQIEEIEAPDWWFKWELEDVNGAPTYAYAGAQREEVCFIATHWRRR
jgi:hypothetical protein